MKNAKYYKMMFFVAAIWNIGAALPCWLGGIFMPDITFKMFGMPVPASLFPFHAMFWFIIFFGLGYLMVSRDIMRNHGIVIIGMLAKFIFFTDCLVTVYLKEGSMMLAATGFVDLVFAVLFLEFLLSVRKAATK